MRPGALRIDPDIFQQPDIDVTDDIGGGLSRDAGGAFMGAVDTVGLRPHCADHGIPQGDGTVAVAATNNENTRGLPGRRDGGISSDIQLHRAAGGGPPESHARGTGRAGRVTPARSGDAATYNIDVEFPRG